MSDVSSDLTDICHRALTEQVHQIRSGKDGLRVCHIPEDTELSQEMHFHLEPELFVQLTGTAGFHCPGETFVLHPGQLCVMPPKVPHKDRPQKPYKDFLYIVISFFDTAISFHLGSSTSAGKTHVQEARLFPISRLHQIKTCLDDAILASRQQTSHRDVRIQGAMLSCLAHLLETLSLPPVQRETGQFRITRCKQLISIQLTNPDLSVKSLAETLNCSADYLSSLFHQETNMRLTQYINSQRIAVAQHLLESSTLNISQIARAVGYADAGYFSRVFRKLGQISPRQYRQNIVERLQTSR